jgi:hypothetical protein
MRGLNRINPLCSIFRFSLQKPGVLSEIRKDAPGCMPLKWIFLEE